MKRTIMALRSEVEFKKQTYKLEKDTNVEDYFYVKKRLPKLGIYYFVYVNPTEKQKEEYLTLREKQRNASYSNCCIDEQQFQETEPELPL